MAYDTERERQTLVQIDKILRLAEELQREIGNGPRLSAAAEVSRDTALKEIALVYGSLGEHCRHNLFGAP